MKEEDGSVPPSLLRLSVQFLQLMSKQQAVEHTRGDLLSAFRIFDDDDDGCIHAGDLVDVLTSFGEKLTKSEARKLVQTAAKKEDGLIDYKGNTKWEVPL